MACIRAGWQLIVDVRVRQGVLVVLILVLLELVSDQRSLRTQMAHHVVLHYALDFAEATVEHRLEVLASAQELLVRVNSARGGPLVARSCPRRPLARWDDELNVGVD